MLYTQRKVAPLTHVHSYIPILTFPSLIHAQGQIRIVLDFFSDDKPSSRSLSLVSGGLVAAKLSMDNSKPGKDNVQTGLDILCVQYRTVGTRKHVKY